MLRLGPSLQCPECAGELQALCFCPECRHTTIPEVVNAPDPEIACSRCGGMSPTRFVCVRATPRPGHAPPAQSCAAWYSYEQVFASAPTQGDAGHVFHEPAESDIVSPRPHATERSGKTRIRPSAPSLKGLLSQSPGWSNTASTQGNNGHVNGTGRVNGLVNGVGPAKGSGRVNGLVNGVGPARGSGRVNGLVNGRGPSMGSGRVNGLTNGRGAAKGPGRVNGLVNGIGVPDGAPTHAFPPPPPPPRRRLDPRLIIIVASLLMAVAILSGLFSPPEATREILIDGVFDDWSPVPAYPDGTTSANPDVNIRSASLKFADDSLYFRVEVAGSIFPDPADYDTIHGFFDVDGNLTTGYDLGDLGADYVARVSGSRGAVENAMLFRFEGDDSADWNGWKSVVDLSAAAKGRQVEAEVPAYLLQDFDASSLRARFASDDNLRDTSHTVVPIGLALGALRVRHESLATTLMGGPQAFLGLRFEAVGPGARVHVERVEIQASAGTSIDGVPEDFDVVEGSPVVHVITADPLTLPQGSVVSARVKSVAADHPFAIVGSEARAYVGQLPSETEKRVDGLFAEWTKPRLDGPDSPGIGRASADIVGWDGSVADDEVFLYVKLLGQALEGSLVPDRSVRPRADAGGPAGNSSAPRPPPPRIGRDYIRFYLGRDEGGGGLTLDGRSFDRLVDIQGRRGRVDNASGYRWSGTEWRWEVPVTTGIGAEELEAGILISGAAANATWIVVVTADWSGVADATEPEQREGTRGSPGLLPLHGTNALTALAKPLTNVPTVDGNCGTSSNEYQGADELSNSNLKFLVGRRSATSRVYVCLEVTADTTDDGAVDSGRLLFDRNHDGGSAPQSDDRRFRVTSGGSLTSEKGNGATWVSCGGSCYSPSAVGAFNNSRQVYEFSISFWDVWGTNSTTVNQVAGFAVLGFDDTTFTTYTWGSDNINQNNPGTWGHLQIPEFPAGLLAGVPLIVFAIAVRRASQGRTRRSGAFRRICGNSSRRLTGRMG